MGWQEHLGGAASAHVATVMFAGTAPTSILPAAPGRAQYEIWAQGDVWLGFGATPVPSQSWPVPSGAYWKDTAWNGEVQIRTTTGSAPFFVRDLRAA